MGRGRWRVRQGGHTALVGEELPLSPHARKLTQRPLPPPPYPFLGQIALYYESDLPSLGEHATPASPPDTRLRLGPPPPPPIKALPAAGVGDAPDGVASAHMAGGAGTATFAVANLRWPVVAALQAPKWGRLSVEAVSGAIAFSQPDAPQQARAGAGPEPGTATVRWATAGGAAAPRVRWGWAPDNLTAGDVPARGSATYAAADLCGGDAVAYFANPGAHHTAVIRWAAEEASAGGGLGGPGTQAGRTQPGARRRVFYEAYDGGAAPGAPTAAGSFLPLAADPAATAHMLIVADVGQGEPDGAARVTWQYAASRNTSAALAREAAATGGTGFAATSIMVGGDVSYANGHGPVWDAFFTQFGGALAAAPALFAVGNHELLWPVGGVRGSGGGGGATAAAASLRSPPAWPGDRYGNLSDSGGECGVPYNVRTGGGSGAAGGPDGSGRANPHWYSFDDGPVHVNVYSTEEPFEVGSPQHAWIAADLGGVNRSRTPWLVVVGHRPPYLASAYPGGGNASDAAVAVALATHLEPLWLAAGVDATFAGHHHSYQRTCPMAGKGRCADGRRTAAGAAGYGAVSSTARTSSSPGYGGPVHVVAGIGGADLTDNAMPWPTPTAWEAIAFEHGYVRLSANAEALAVTAVRSSDGSVLDAFQLSRAEPGVVRTLGGSGVGAGAGPDVAAASLGAGPDVAASEAAASLDGR